MARIQKPPAPIDSNGESNSVFLAGSIEMGVAKDWQSYISEALSEEQLLILNPRRDEWDSTWEQTISNPTFREQVEWELAGLEIASVIAMYYEPSTKSPITMLELGLFARSEKVIVCCPDGFWRKGNIEVVCERYQVPMVETLDDLVAAIRSRMKHPPLS